MILVKLMDYSMIKDTHETCTDSCSQFGQVLNSDGTCTLECKVATNFDYHPIIHVLINVLENISIITKRTIHALKNVKMIMTIKYI